MMESCGQIKKTEDRETNLVDEAKEAMESTIRYFIDETTSDISFSNIKNVFCNDSLCILHFTLSAQNELGIEEKANMEYVYLISHNKKYETFQIEGNDDVYLTKSEFKSKSEGTIFESIPYEEGLYYFAAIAINNEGRVVGDNEGKYAVSIPIPIKTDMWEINYYTDDFGENTSGKYLALKGKGTFSNSATTGSSLTAYLFVTKSEKVTIRLIEYDSRIVKSGDCYICKFKDSEGEVHEISLYNDEEYGELHTFSIYEDENALLLSAIKKGGIISFSIKEEYAYSTPDTYIFKMDVSGYEEAYSQL